MKKKMIGVDLAEAWKPGSHYFFPTAIMVKNPELHDLGVLVKEQCEIERLENEIQRLHEFTRQLAERLFLAAEVLSILAEKKSQRNGNSKAGEM